MNKEPLDSTMMAKIVNARITDLPKRLGDPLPEIWITLSDGSEKMLFRYYPDEISFSEAELVGLTEDEARLLKFGRDRAYLQS
jgi:hypothetical protein